MRRLLIAIAIIGGVVSISLCGLYGWKQATALEDKLIAAIQYGFVALLALILDMLAIRVWVSGWLKCGAFIAFAALGCFLMTATTSLGGMVTRSDRAQAERQRVLDSKQDAQTRIAELTAERQQTGSVPYTTGAAVEAAKRLAEAATAQRKAECGENNEKRGRLRSDGSAPWQTCPRHWPIYRQSYETLPGHQRRRSRNWWRCLSDECALRRDEADRTPWHDETQKIGNQHD